MKKQKISFIDNMFIKKQKSFNPINSILRNKNISTKKQPVTPMKFQTQWKQFTTTQKTVNKILHKDTDRDGVPDRWDCQPRNPWKQDSKIKMKNLTETEFLLLKSILSNFHFSEEHGPATFWMDITNPKDGVDNDRIYIEPLNKSRNYIWDIYDWDKSFLRIYTETDSRTEKVAIETKHTASKIGIRLQKSFPNTKIIYSD